MGKNYKVKNIWKLSCTKERIMLRFCNKNRANKATWLEKTQSTAKSLLETYLIERTGGRMDAEALAEFVQIQRDRIDEMNVRNGFFVLINITV